MIHQGSADCRRSRLSALRGIFLRLRHKCRQHTAITIDKTLSFRARFAADLLRMRPHKRQKDASGRSVGSLALTRSMNAFMAWRVGPLHTPSMPPR